MRFPIGLAFLHPLFLVAATVAAMASPFLGEPGSTAVCLGVVLLQVGWAYGFYNASAAALDRRAGVRLPSRGPLFAFTAAIMVLAAFVTPLHVSSPLSAIVAVVVVLGFLGFAWTQWAAATALVSFEEGAVARRPTNATVGTLLALIYAPFGAWFLRPRALKLRTVLERRE